LRGHGNSEKPRGSYAIADFLLDYLEIFREFQLRDFVLVGCSVGGIVAQLYALEYGSNCKALFLSDRHVLAVGGTSQAFIAP